MLFRSGIAQALHVPFINRPFRLTQGYPFELLLSSGVARFEDATGESSVIAAPRGHFFEDLMLRIFAGDKAPPIILTTPSNFRRAILTQFGRTQADQDVQRLGQAFPEFSAERLKLRSFIGLMAILPVCLTLGILVKSDFWTAGLYLLSALFVADRKSTL